MLCENGLSDLFPEIKQCPNEATTYIFGDKYCDKCAAELVELHKAFNTVHNSGGY